MKKITWILVLTLLVAAGTAFAQHPDGLGVGVGWQLGSSWESPSDLGNALSLFIKAPQSSIYWGISADVLHLNDSRFWVSLTGDHYLIDSTLIPNLNLGFFLGIGVYFKFDHYGSTYNGIDLGVRVPIGLSWQPIDWFEVFFDVAPSIGFYSHFGNTSKVGIGGGWQGDIGIRFWF